MNWFINVVEKSMMLFDRVPIYRYVTVSVVILAFFLLAGCQSSLMSYVETMQDHGNIKVVDVNENKQTIRVEMK